MTVPPAGFEDLAPYAWVVMELDDSAIRVSGFLAKIPTPEDLPIGTPVSVAKQTFDFLNSLKGALILLH